MCADAVSVFRDLSSFYVFELPTPVQRSFNKLSDSVSFYLFFFVFVFLIMLYRFVNL